jgi:mRNA-degrading endonuclease HigB of HigAB toxin-antitoxin module
MILLIFSLLFIFLILFTVKILIDYSVHYDMTSTNNFRFVEKVSLSELKKELITENWGKSKYCKYSIFPVDFFSNSQIHASIIEIKGNRYYMKNIIEYIKFKIFLRRVYNSDVNLNEYLNEKIPLEKLL